MITNLLATIIITLTTNTVETNNGKVGCPLWYTNNHSPDHVEVFPTIPPIYKYCQGQPVPATERTITTTVKERIEVDFDLDGKRTVAQDRVVSETAKKFRAKTEWEGVNPLRALPMPTNSFSYIMLTNGTMPMMIDSNNAVVMNTNWFKIEAGSGMHYVTNDGVVYLEVNALPKKTNEIAHLNEDNTAGGITNYFPLTSSNFAYPQGWVVTNITVTNIINEPKKLDLEDLGLSEDAIEALRQFMKYKKP